MDIKEVQELKKEYDKVNSKIMESEAEAKIVLRSISDILKEYGINSIKEYSKLLELKENRKREASEFYNEVKNYIEVTNNKFSEIESIINS